MNYYTNSRNDYLINNRYNNEYYDNYSKNYDNDYCEKNYNNGYDQSKRSCCLKRVEETYICFPSYYNEENKDNKKEKCFEGTFKICPKYYNDENDCKDKEDKKDDHKCGCRCHNRCGFCGIFKRW